MSGNVLPFKGKPFNGPTDPVLTCETERIRSALHVRYDSHGVIASPMLGDYEPNVQINGIVQMGEPGVEDFSKRFGFIEGIVPTRMLALYAVTRHALSRRVLLDRSFHERLGGVANEFLPVIPKSLYNGNLHVVESLLLGRMAAYCAIGREEMDIESKPLRQMLPGQIMSGAEKDIPIADEHAEDRDKVMLHFSLSLNHDQKAALTRLVIPSNNH